MTKKLCFGKRYDMAGIVMKAILFLSLILLPMKGYALEAGDRAPGFQAVTLDAKEISYERDLKGKRPVYLIFWATW